MGKTEAAKALAGALDTPLIRLQCYEGLTAAEALYEWNYPRQLLAIRLAEARGETLRDADLFSDGVPARPAAAGRARPSGPASGGAADRRGGPGRRRVRGVPVRAAGRVRGDHPRAGHPAGHVPPGRGADLQPHPRPARRAEAALPVPLDRLPGHRAGRGDHPPPGARRGRRRSPGRWRAASPGCATSTWPSRPAWPRPSAGPRRSSVLGAGPARRGGGGADRRRGAQVRRGPAGGPGGFGDADSRDGDRRAGHPAMAVPSDLADDRGAVRRRAAARRACRPSRAGASGSRPRSRSPGRRTRRALYLCALATLVSGPGRHRVLRARVQRRCSAARARRRPGRSAGRPDARARPTPEDCWPARPARPRTHAGQPGGPGGAVPGQRPAGGAAQAGAGRARQDAEEPEPEARRADRPLWPARAERLAGKDFAELTPAELLMLAGLMRKLTLAVPHAPVPPPPPHAARQAHRPAQPRCGRRGAPAGTRSGWPGRPRPAGRASWSCCATSPGRWSRTRGPCSSCCTAPRAARGPRCSPSPPG